ncbi:MAG: alkaline phosphatase family protein [Chitinophagales bacterium]|nr:alkaline phosphatase family protein [Chitinophagales bacterium]
MAKRLAKKVLLVGWDAADWKIINPLMDAGLMPALQKLVENGSIGNIATMDPPLSPILWTTIATGKRPYKHGVLGFVEPADNPKGIGPVLSTSRKVKAIWNILSEKDLKTNVVGWWPSYPAETINGISVSNYYQLANRPMNEPWPLPQGCIYPTEKHDLFADMRIHPGEITAAHLLSFVPNAAKVDQDKDKKLHILCKLLADCASIQSAATYILEHEPWDFTAVYFNALDLLCHHFMPFHPPKQAHIEQEQFELYRDVITAAYRFFDMMLERLLQLAGPEATIMLVSDHGFHPDHMRLKNLPKDPVAPAFEHSQYGVLCLKGEGIKQDELIYGAGLADIAPTILTLFGLPVAEDMDGKPLLGAFSNTIVVERIETWEDTKEVVPSSVPTNSEQSDELLQQLIDLGYVETPTENGALNKANTLKENRFFLARSYMDAHLYQHAIPILLDLHREYAQELRYGYYAARCLQLTGEKEKARQILNEIKTKLPQNAFIKLLDGMLLLDEQQPKLALEAFKSIKAKEHQGNVHFYLGQAYLALRRLKYAEEAFLAALSHNFENAYAHQGLGLVYLQKGKHEKAADELLTSIGLVYNNGLAHYQLGVALYHLGRYEQAVQALEVSLKLSPGLNKAREKLMDIFEHHLHNGEKLQYYRQEIERYTKGEIIIVSGLPRSGTSMMMQMLQAGGIEIYTDNERGADENNPKGYLEHEQVKQLATNNQWLWQAKGKAVKVINYLLPYLPSSYKYKIIFMEREISEIIASQNTMLSRNGKGKADEIKLGLLEKTKLSLEETNEWLAERKNVSVLRLSYRDVINSPEEHIANIANFLETNLDESAMLKAIDSSLYRIKKVPISI